MPTYTLISVTEVSPDGKVQGVWLQDCSRGFEVACQVAQGTSDINSGLRIAVIEGGGGGFNHFRTYFGKTPLFITEARNERP